MCMCNYRKIRDQAKLMTNEDYILKYIQFVKDAMWPNDVLLRDKPVRSAKDRKKSRMEASVMLATLVPGSSSLLVLFHILSLYSLAPVLFHQHKRKKSQMLGQILTINTDMTASIVGRANAQAASRRLFAMYNNPRLNCHVVFTILDVLIDVLFPELEYTL